jgi:hypothetical protein
VKAIANALTAAKSSILFTQALPAAIALGVVVLASKRGGQ